MSKELTEQELEDAKQVVCDEVDAISDVLLEASHAIHANPELNFEEHFAHDCAGDSEIPADRIAIDG